MITLYGFGPAFGLPDPSPFVMKVDAYLRMTGMAFEKLAGIKYMRQAPKGKLPYIEDDGQVVSDSFFILQHLKAKYGDPLDEWLTPEQRAVSDLTIKSLDENFYWCVVQSRWLREDTWPQLKAVFFDRLPVPLKFIAPVMARRGVTASVNGHGIGKHSNEEIDAIARFSLQALSDLLGDKTYFMGGQPCTLDAAVYGFLSQPILSEIDNTLAQAAREFTNLVDFCERIRAKYYTD